MRRSSLFAAGAGDRIVGAVRGSNHPAAARDIPIVGDVHALDLERIVALKPDLVITWPYTTPAQVAKLKRARRRRCSSTDPRVDRRHRARTSSGSERSPARPESRPRQPRTLSRRDRARDDAGTIGSRACACSTRSGARRCSRSAASHLITQAIRACGGENVFASLAIPAPQVSIEAVIAARPDTIIAGSRRRANARRGSTTGSAGRTVPAVRDRLLQVVDADRLHRPGPRFADRRGRALRGDRAGANCRCAAREVTRS